MARSLTFPQIQAFKALMQSGTTVQAANMLNTTQPSISRRIAELQSATELKLFELHRGRLRPTSEGRLLFATIQRHFDGLEKIESVVAAMRKSGTGVLRIGCTPTLAMGLLPLAMRRFLERFPDTYVNIQTLGTQQLADYLRQDLCDLALTTGTFDPRDFQPQVIRTDAAVCVLPAGHALRTAKVIQVRQLAQERIVSLSDLEDTTVRIKKLLMQGRGGEESLIETSSSITICALVAAGVGIGIVNPYVAPLFGNQLVLRPLSPTIEFSVQMALPPHIAPSLLTRRFIEILRAEAVTVA